MSNKTTFKRELKGLGKDLATAIGVMLKSNEFKSLEKEIASSAKAIAKNISQSVKVAQKSKSAKKLKRRIRRVVKAGKVEGKKEAIKAQAAATRGLKKARQNLRRLKK